MAKYQMNQLKDGDQYWTPKFDNLTKRFETDFVEYDLGCWGDVEDGWAFDNEEECLALCKKLNGALVQVEREEEIAGCSTDNFTLLESRESKLGYTVNIFVPKEGMEEVPEDLVERYLNADYDYYDIVHDPEGVRWSGGNHDMGVYDALVVKHFTRKAVDIYVCDILRRPFTEEEAAKYESIFMKGLRYRLTHIFDNHVNPDFTVFE